MHVKGLELPGYDVRGAKAHGLGYATSYTGADHCRGYAFQEIFGIPIPYEVDRFAAEGKGKLTKWNQDIRMATCDCPTMCAFLLDMAVPAIAAQNTAALLTAVTGLTFTEEGRFSDRRKGQQPGPGLQRTGGVSHARTTPCPNG